MGFGGISIWQLIILAVLFSIYVLIFGTVAKKAGFSRWWIVLLLVPVINIGLIWLFAFAKWPAEQLRSDT